MKDEETILSCGECDGDEFVLTPAGNIYCASCDGKMNARVMIPTQRKPIMSTNGLWVLEPCAEA